jgi:hypothetical protein
MGPQRRQDPISARLCLGIAGASESHGLLLIITPPPTTMILTTEEMIQLVTTGMVELTDDLMLRMSESYEDSEWYNDPNNVMSKHHY